MQKGSEIGVFRLYEGIEIALALVLKREHIVARKISKSRSWSALPRSIAPFRSKAWRLQGT
jgi:hypothetical protein